MINPLTPKEVRALSRLSNNAIVAINALLVEMFDAQESMAKIGCTALTVASAPPINP